MCIQNEHLISYEEKSTGISKKVSHPKTLKQQDCRCCWWNLSLTHRLFVQAKIKDIYFKHQQEFEVTNLHDGNVCVCVLYLSIFCVEVFVVQPALFANVTEGGCSQVRRGVAFGPGLHLLHLGLQALCKLQHTSSLQLSSIYFNGKNEVNSMSCGQK